MRWLIALLSVLILSGAQAQQRQQRAVPAQPAGPPAVVQPPPPTGYEPLLLRLSEILGAVAYLSDLCAAPASPSKSTVFRQKMRDLIDSEAQNDLQRDRYAGAYNRGFADYQVIHRTCTTVSRAALDRLIQEGGRLSQEIATRFGS